MKKGNNMHIMKSVSIKNIKKHPSKFLSIMALAFTIFSCISYFFYYTKNEEAIYVLKFNFPYFARLLTMLIELTPFILFILYQFKFYKALKAKCIVPIIFGLLAFKLLPIVFLMIEEGGFAVLLAILFIIAFIAAILGVFTGIKNKLFAIIYMSFCILFYTFQLINISHDFYFYIKYSMYMYIFTDLLKYLGGVLLCTSFIVFIVKHKIPPIFVKKQKKEKMIDPEQALKLLKDKLELGIITEEEFQTQRAEIIKRL